MRVQLLAILLISAGPGKSDVLPGTFVIGPEQVWIEVSESGETMWVGPDAEERTLVLSGPDITIVTQVTDEDAAAMLGVRGLVAVVPASHSCDDLSEALSYSVVTLGPSPVTDGPLMSCGTLEVSVTPGAILLQRDQVDQGQSWAWVPGAGFEDRLE